MSSFIHIVQYYRHILLMAVCLTMGIQNTYALTSPSSKNKKENTEYKNYNYYKAKQLMKKVFSYVEDHHFNKVEYQSNVYIKHHMRTKRKGPIVRYLPGMLRLERGKHDYLSEIQLRFQYHQSGEMDCKITAYHTTAHYQRADRMMAARRFNFQIYDSHLFLDCILNPLHERNKRFYRYRYNSNLLQAEHTDSIVRINIQPRFDNDQLVKGYIDMNTRTGAVTHFLFSFRYQMQKLTVNGSLGKKGYDTLIPLRMRIVSNFNLFGNRINEVYDIVSQHHFKTTDREEIDPQKRYDLTEQCLLRIDTAQVINRISYFDRIRPLPLRKFETEIIQSYLKTQKVGSRTSTPDVYPAPQDTASTDTLRSDTLTLVSPSPQPVPSRNWNFGHILDERTKNLLLDSHHFNLGKRIRSNFSLPAIITPSHIDWSKNKGVTLKAKAQWNLFLLPKDFLPTIELSPRIAYSFKQKQIYWDIPLLVRLMPKLDGTFSFRANGGSHMYNNRQAEDVLKALEGIEKYDSLVQFLEHYGFHDYRNTNVDMDFGLSPVPGLRLTLGTRYRQHTLIEWNKYAGKTGILKYLKSIGPFAHIEWTPQQYYYRKGVRRIPLYSYYPTFILNYERGFQLRKGNTDYERIEFDTRYRLPLYAMRTLFFRFGFGLFTHKGDDCFLSYDFFNFSYMPDEWKDELTGEFQLLNSRWYYESSYYTRFTGTYESPMMMLARIPGVTRIVQKERVYLNLLNVKRLGLYTELGYGFSTHLFDIGTFMSIAGDKSVGFGCKFVFRFFED